MGLVERSTITFSNYGTTAILKNINKKYRHLHVGEYSKRHNKIPRGSWYCQVISLFGIPWEWLRLQHEQCIVHLGGGHRLWSMKTLLVLLKLGLSIFSFKVKDALFVNQPCKVCCYQAGCSRVLPRRMSHFSESEWTHACITYLHKNEYTYTNGIGLSDDLLFGRTEAGRDGPKQVETGRDGPKRAEASRGEPRRAAVWPKACGAEYSLRTALP